MLIYTCVYLCVPIFHILLVFLFFTIHNPKGYRCIYMFCVYFYFICKFSFRLEFLCILQRSFCKGACLFKSKVFYMPQCLCVCKSECLYFFCKVISFAVLWLSVYVLHECACMCVCLNLCVFVWVWVCVCVCVCVSVSMCLFVSL